MKKIAGISLLILAIAMIIIGITLKILAPAMTGIGFILIGLVFIMDTKK